MTTMKTTKRTSKAKPPSQQRMVSLEFRVHEIRNRFTWFGNLTETVLKTLGEYKSTLILGGSRWPVGKVVTFVEKANEQLKHGE